jgi:cation diffusion facilitator family transporter
MRDHCCMTPPAPSSPLSSHKTALIGLLVNVALAMVKLISGIVGHSGALIADAAESLADIAGSAVIWGGLRIGAIPADEDHPYGHGKAEALAGLVVACILVGAGVGIAVQAWRDIRTPHLAPEPWTLAVLVLVIVAKYSMFVVARRVARREGSGAMHVDAGHHVSDAVTSLAAGVGICVAVFGERMFGKATLAPGSFWGTGWESADDWAALLASAVIVYNAAQLMRVPLRELMDTTTGEDVSRAAEPARQVAMSVEGVRHIEKVRVRKSGGGYWLEMHVQVDGGLPVREGHAIGGCVRARVRTEVPGVRDVHVHIEPFER